ncbi:MAG TPA: MMPL family transporter [Gaiellaceae bacterium]|nr:MMPL family transporter [Gaiellaceae bacterium]
MAVTRNLAGRAGRWSAAHWKRASVGWFALTFAAFFAASAVGLNRLGDSQSGSGETARAESMLRHADFLSPARESVLIQARDGSRVAGTPRLQSAEASLVQTLSGLAVVGDVARPVLSRDGRSSLIQFAITGSADTADKRVQPALDAVAAAQAGNPTFRIEEFGMASANHVIGETVTNDFRRAEYTSIPVTLAILLLAFGALVAALLPVVLGFTAVLGAIGLSILLSHAYPIPSFMDSVILMMGMAVGIDYSLFYLQREREERRRGESPAAALLTAARTSGRAVLISGVTVLIAMAGLFFAGNPIFTSMGLATEIVVLLAMVGSVTVLPALLHALGDRVDRGRVPFAGGGRRGEGRAWRAILHPALAHPKLAVLGAGGLLLAAASPALSIHTKLPSFTDLPHDVPIVRTYERLIAAFPGAPTPAVVVVRAPDVTAPAVRDQIAELERRALASRQVRAPISTRVSPDRTVAEIDLPLVGTGDDRASMRALALVRGTLLPQTIGSLPAAEYATTGVAAATEDFNALMKQRLPIVFAFVLALAFVLLLLTFRSVVVPLTAIVLNLLSVGAAYGLLTLAFQHTWFEGVLGFTSNGGITSWLPMFLFVVLFGLSMDYHVFIVNRVKELADRGLSTEEAVRQGIVRTAPSVTSAAAVMVAVFAIFATLSLLQFKQLGFGLAVAIAVDATIVRAVLLPATMKLLGPWNWYLPRWLEWLPNGEDAEIVREDEERAARRGAWTISPPVPAAGAPATGRPSRSPGSSSPSSQSPSAARSARTS